MSFVRAKVKKQNRLSCRDNSKVGIIGQNILPAKQQPKKSLQKQTLIKKYHNALLFEYYWYNHKSACQHKIFQNKKQDFSGMIYFSLKIG